MSNFNFTGKVAIVTGAGVGIGFEICSQLAQQGAKVILNDIDAQLANRAAAQINEDNGHCLAIPGDVGQTDFTQLLVKKTVERYGQLDIVICNAGITLFSNFFDYTEEAFYKVLQVNMGGTFFLTQAAARHMKTQTAGGSILFTSSVVGHQAHKQLAAYAMTKAGIEMLARNLVIELAQYNINVNAIAPGATLTERTQEDKDYAATWAKLSPTGSVCTTKNIADAALFLVSSNAKQITGQTLVIDGGWSAISPSPF
jgi:glucose 1-dehydrogenase